jgi:hypothetical protein
MTLFSMGNVLLDGQTINSVRGGVKREPVFSFQFSVFSFPGPAGFCGCALDNVKREREAREKSLKLRVFRLISRVSRSLLTLLNQATRKNRRGQQFSVTKDKRSPNAARSIKLKIRGKKLKTEN